MEDNLDKTIDQIQSGMEAKFQTITDTMEEMKKENVSKAEMQKIHDSITEQGETLTEFKEEIKSAKGKFFGEQLKSFLTANKEEIKQIQKRGSGVIEFKVDQEEADAATKDLLRASGTIGTVPAWNDVSLPNVMLRKDNPLLSYARNYSTNTASQPYSEITAQTGNAAAVAEGGTKPQVDFVWETNYATPYKVAAYEVLSEEVVDDIPRMMDVAKGFLKQKHDIKKVEYVYFGDGVGQNPSGATVIASPYAPVASLTAKVTTPNIMDVINSALLSIYEQPPIVDGIPFMGNIVMLNPGDFALEFVMAKDGNGLPLYPQAAMFNQIRIGSTTIVPWSEIPAGKIFVADMKKYNLGNYIPYFIKIGWINDQLINNMFTIVGESRFFAYVKNQDVKALMYDDVSVIRTSITKP